MVIGLLAVGMTVGAVFGLYTLVTGGSFLFALAVYSGVGTSTVIFAAALVGFVSRLRKLRADWQNDDVVRDPQSA